jgi:creatinine amidohydrolase
MFPDEVEAALRKSSVAYVPLGSLEWHGPHIAMGNDTLKIHAICLRIAEKTGGVVLPPTFWGIAGGYQDRILKREHYSVHVNHAFLLESLYVTIFSELVRIGVKLIVPFCGHTPTDQIEIVRVAAGRANEHSQSRILVLSDIDVCWRALGVKEDYVALGKKGDYSRMMQIIEDLFAKGLYGGDHAAFGETSLLMYLRPELVDMKRLPVPPAPEDKWWRAHGISGLDPTKASAEAGKRMVTRIVDEAAKIVLRELGRA